MAAPREYQVPSSVFHAIEESKRILKWENNWDGEGTPGYTKATWQRAVSFVRDNAMRLREVGQLMEAPDIQPGEKGRIIIEWSAGDRELIVTIPADANDQAEFYGYDHERSITIKGHLHTDSPHSSWLLMWTVK